MALNDLTDQNIQDTYQKVVQTDGTNLADGTGSALPIKFNGPNVETEFLTTEGLKVSHESIGNADIGTSFMVGPGLYVEGDILATGDIIAHQYIVSSSVTHITTQTLSGSTEFGDSSDDTHQFTGHITASGTISASGIIYGSGLDIKRDTNSVAEIGRAHVGYVGHSDFAGFSHIDQNATSTYALLQQNNGTTYLNAASNRKIHFRIANSTIAEITSTGLTTTDLTTTGDTVLGNAVTDMHTITGHISASGDVSCSGTFTTETLNGDIGEATGLEINGYLSASAGTGSFTTMLYSSGEISASGVITGEGLYISDDAEIVDDLTLGGSIIFDGNTITGINDSGEFDDDDAHIMTSAGINDKFALINANTTGTAGGLSATLAVSSGGTGAGNLDAFGLLAGTQTFSGTKTFSETIVGSVNGNSATTSETTITSGQATQITNNIPMLLASGGGVVNSPVKNRYYMGNATYGWHHHNWAGAFIDAHSDGTTWASSKPAVGDTFLVAEDKQSIGVIIPVDLTSIKCMMSTRPTGNPDPSEVISVFLAVTARTNTSSDNSTWTIIAVNEATQTSGVWIETDMTSAADIDDDKIVCMGFGIDGAADVTSTIKMKFSLIGYRA